MPTAGKRTLREQLRHGERLLRRLLRPEVCEDAGFEAFLLLQKVYGITRTEYTLQADALPCPDRWQEYRALLRRRISGEPVQYILEEWEFLGLPFAVGEGVLIPRPETELLAETVISFLKGQPHPQVLELCGGSGCLAVAIAHARPDAAVTTVELSPEALEYLKKNAAQNGTRNVKIVAGDALYPDAAITEKRYHVILSNPPYIRTDALPALQSEVRREPKMALDGGNDGLDFYRRFCEIYPPLLEGGGLLAFEIGEEQGEAVKRLMEAAGLREIQVRKDFAGNDRVVTAIK